MGVTGFNHHIAERYLEESLGHPKTLQPNCLIGRSFSQRHVLSFRAGQIDLSLAFAGPTNSVSRENKTAESS